MEAKNSSNEFLSIMRFAQTLVTESFTPICRQYGISTQQMKILSALYHKKNQTVGELSQSTQILRSNITSVCKKMEKDGYLVRSRSMMDERVVRVSLTDKGTKIMETIGEKIEEYYENILKGESEETCRVIHDGLQKLCELLEKTKVEKD